MLIRLLLVPLVLSTLLLTATSLVSWHLGQDEVERNNLLKAKTKEIVQLKLKNTFGELKSRVDLRSDFYRSIHSDFQSRLSENTLDELIGFKTEFYDRYGFDIDLFLIDGNYVVTHTTFEPDLGLDFKLPFFRDAQAALKQTATSQEINVGVPTQEFVSRQYKLYTLSSINSDLYFQIGFLDPQLSVLFDAAQRSLEETDNVVQATLYMDNWGSFLSPLSQFSDMSDLLASDLEKTELMEVANQRLSAEYEIFKRVTAQDSLEVPLDLDAGLSALYVELDRIEYTSDIVYRQLAKINI